MRSISLKTVYACPPCFKGEHDGCYVAEAKVCHEYEDYQFLADELSCACYVDGQESHLELARERMLDWESLTEKFNQECSCDHCIRERNVTP